MKILVKSIPRSSITPVLMEQILPANIVVLLTRGGTVCHLSTAPNNPALWVTGDVVWDSAPSIMELLDRVLENDTGEVYVFESNQELLDWYIVRGALIKPMQ